MLRWYKLLFSKIIGNYWQNLTANLYQLKLRSISRNLNKLTPCDLQMQKKTIKYSKKTLLVSLGCRSWDIRDTIRLKCNLTRILCLGQLWSQAENQRRFIDGGFNGVYYVTADHCHYCFYALDGALARRIFNDTFEHIRGAGSLLKMFVSRKVRQIWSFTADNL